MGVSDSHCLPDVKILIKIERTTGMNLIKTTRPHCSFVGELWFGRPIEQKKLQP
jgi:hypothetical protein